MLKIQGFKPVETLRSFKFDPVVDLRSLPTTLAEPDLVIILVLGKSWHILQRLSHRSVYFEEDTQNYSHVFEFEYLY